MCSKKERVAHGFEMDSVVVANNRPTRPCILSGTPNVILKQGDTSTQEFSTDESIFYGGIFKTKLFSVTIVL